MGSAQDEATSVEQRARKRGGETSIIANVDGAAEKR
jgi:hypothetical protein